MVDPVTPAPAPADPAVPDTHTRLKPAEKAALAAQLTGEVVQLKGNEAVNAYQLGVRLARLHHGGLYQATGAKSWKEYLSTNVKLGKTQATKWMRVASHFTEAAVTSYGIEVLDGLAKSLDQTHSPVPADLSAVVVHTPAGDKHLGELSEVEAEGAFRAPHTQVSLDPSDQAQLDTFTRLLARLGPEAHVSGSASKGGARVVFSLPLAKVARLAQLLVGAGAKAKAKPRKPAKKPAKPAGKRKKR